MEYAEKLDSVLCSGGREFSMVIIGGNITYLFEGASVIVVMDFKFV